MSNENKNIMFITKTEEDNIVDKPNEEIDYIKMISVITLENAINEITDDTTNITNTFEELNRVNRDIDRFDAGEINDITLGDGLTTEMSILDITKLSYNKINNDKDRIIEKAYEYIRALVNKVIGYLKKLYLNYNAVNSNHAELAKELYGRLNSVSLTTVTLNDKISSLENIYAAFDKNNELSLECLPFIVDKVVAETLVKKIKSFGNTISIIRPNDKTILNNTDLEYGNARADIMKHWNDTANKKFIDEFVNTSKNKQLKDRAYTAKDLSDSYIDFRNVATYEPFTTDGKNINLLYQTPEHQLRIMRAEVKNVVPGAILEVSKLKDYVLAMSKSDIGNLVKKDIKTIESIEKDAKIYFKQVRDELGADKGKRNASFNNIVTLINSGLTIAGNRVKFGNAILIASRDVARYLGDI